MNALKTLPLAALLLLSGCAALPYAIMAASSLAQAEQEQQQQRAMQAESERIMKEHEERQRAAQAQHQQQIQAAEADWARRQQEALERQRERTLAPAMLALRSRVHDAQTFAAEEADPNVIFRWVGMIRADQRQMTAKSIIFVLAQQQREALYAEELKIVEREQRRYERAERARRAQQRSQPSTRSSYGGWGGGGKVCSKGCPCGRSCISCKKTCRK